MTASDPTIERFLERHPALRRPVAEVLACGVAVRQARESALPDEDRRAVVPGGAAIERAEGELAGAVEAMERLAATVTPCPDEGLETIERLVRAVAALRLHSRAFGAARKTTSPAARSALFAALQAFRSAFGELQEKATACHAGAVPWQIELATHVEPGTPVATLRIDGHDLPQAPLAARAWGERCALSGTQFLADSHEEPADRYRSLDTCEVLAPRFHALLLRLRRACDSLVERCPEAVERLVRFLPALYDDRVADRGHPTFGKLGLLDFPSLAVSLNNMLRLHAERPFLGTRLERRGQDGHYPFLGVADRTAVALRRVASGHAWMRYDDVRRQSLRLAFAFERLGLAPGDRVGIVSTHNCAELWLADFAAVFSGLVPVGLQDTLGDRELHAVASRAQLRAVVCDRASLQRFLTPECRQACPGLERVVVFGGDGASGQPTEGPIRVVELASLLGDAAEPPESWASASGISRRTGILYGDQEGYRTAEAEGIHPDTDDDVYTVLFTSGSTGAPKGTLVTRRRWAEEMCLEANLWPQVRVSYQSPALAVDRILIWRTLYCGGRVGFARRGAGLFQDIRALRPTVLDAPPVFWNSLYSDYKSAVGEARLPPGEVFEIQRRFRESLGGRLALLATGGAASDPGVRRTMETVFGVPMVDNYGTTETGRIAVDGRLLPGLDYRLLPVPELGYDPQDRPYPRGELAVKTPRTTARYMDAADGDADAFTADGYFRTGDIVELGPGGRCSVIGRRKGFFKLAAGEFVCPELLERHYLTSESVEAVLVTGSPLRHAVVAVAVPSHSEVTEEGLLAELRAIGQRAGLRPAEIPLAVILEPRSGGAMPWSVDNGLLTPSLKLNRRALEARYRERIDAAYAAASAERIAGVEAPRPDEESGAAVSRLARIVASLLALPEQDVDTGRSFLDLGGDSITAMELVLRIEQVFSGKGEGGSREEIDPRWLVETPLAEVAGRLARRKSGPPAPRPEAGSRSTRAPAPPTAPRARPAASATPGADEDELAQVHADAESVPLPAALPPAATTGHVLLTGATGFLGVHLLHHLATTLPPGARIYALVRAADDRAAADRLRTAMARARLPVSSGIGEWGSDARVVPIAGSLDRRRLGLADGAYERLAAAVDGIYHVAAQVHFEARYGELRAANVEGTRRLLELATTTTLKAFHFVSTLNVALLTERVTGARCREETPLPAALAAPDVAASLGYTVTKWVCERMIERLFRHSDGRWRASISRPALVTWSQETGIADPANWLTRVLASSLELRCAIGPEEVGVPQWVPETPVSARGLDMVPVDFVARAIGRLGERTRTNGLASDPADPRRVPTFHVSNLAAGEWGLVTVPRLMDLLVAADLDLGGAAGAIRLMPFSRWSERVEAAGAPAVPVLGQLRRMSLLPRTRAERFAAVVAAGDAPIDCPRFDVPLVAAYVRAWYRDGVSNGNGRGRDRA